MSALFCTNSTFSSCFYFNVFASRSTIASICISVFYYRVCTSIRLEALYHFCLFLLCLSLPIRKCLFSALLYFHKDQFKSIVAHFAVPRTHFHEQSSGWNWGTSSPLSLSLFSRSAPSQSPLLLIKQWNDFPLSFFSLPSLCCLPSSPLLEIDSSVVVFHPLLFFQLPCLLPPRYRMSALFLQQIALSCVLWFRRSSFTRFFFDCRFHFCMNPHRFRVRIRLKTSRISFKFVITSLSIPLFASS